jgi:5-keto 4-deoxyuronate isomerase
MTKKEILIVYMHTNGIGSVHAFAESYPLSFEEIKESQKQIENNLSLQQVGIINIIPLGSSGKYKRRKHES